MYHFEIKELYKLRNAWWIQQLLESELARCSGRANQAAGFHRGKKRQLSTSPSFNPTPFFPLFVLALFTGNNMLRASVRRPLTRLLSARRYHAFHENQATVLPNKVETASASFKVSSIFLLTGNYKRKPNTSQENAEKMQKAVDDLNALIEKIKLGQSCSSKSDHANVNLTRL